MAIAALHETVLLAQKLYREGDAPGAEAASCTAASIGSPNVQRCRASRSRRQASVPRMLRSARSKGLIPSDVVTPPSAPASSRALTVSAFHNAARCKGVNPSLSRASNLAPPATKALTVSASPELAATCNGVSPRVSVRASTLAPAPIRALTFATRSSIAARRRALRPNLGGATGRASETMRSSTIRKTPCRLPLGAAAFRRSCREPRQPLRQRSALPPHPHCQILPRGAMVFPHPELARRAWPPLPRNAVRPQRPPFSRNLQRASERNPALPKHRVSGRRPRQTSGLPPPCRVCRTPFALPRAGSGLLRGPSSTSHVIATRRSYNPDGRSTGYRSLGYRLPSGRPIVRRMNSIETGRSRHRVFPGQR